MTLSVIDILFLVTVALLTFNGLRNGAIFSLINLVGLPLGFVVAFYFGPQFARLLAANNLPSAPLISYAVLFFGTVLILHILGTMVRGTVQKIPVVGFGDSLLGGVIGFVEAWLLWVILLFALHIFLNNVLQASQAVEQTTRIIPGFNIRLDQFQAWHDFYNQTINDSLFARVNSFFVKELPALPQLPK